VTKRYHFITGLPRSGSTLLSSILRQNPRFHASITDPLATMTKGVIETSQDGPGIKTEVPVQRRKNIVKALFEGYYHDVDKEVIFNTNRAWTLLTPQIKELYPESRLIVCVRDIEWVLDSFELAHRKNPLSTNTVTGGLSGTVYSRVDSLMDEKGVVGFPYIGIKQAITSDEKNMLMLVEYDQLCKMPKETMQAIYGFIGEPYFEHDFNNVESSWDEYDAEIGIKLHDVRKQVKYTPRQSILPPDIQQKYSNMEVWRL
jgi:sulfotransferase